MADIRHINAIVVGDDRDEVEAVDPSAVGPAALEIGLSIDAIVERASEVKVLGEAPLDRQAILVDIGAAVGLVPTYAQAGVWAPVLLVVLRLIQGFAVAGEISGTSSMILEHAPFGRRGYFASFTLQGVQAGQILAAAVFLPLSYLLSKEAFLSWGWRVPFLLSVLVLIVGIIIRREVEETPAFREEQAKHTTPTAPVKEVLIHHWPDLLRVMCMALMNVIPVVATIFGAAYAVQPGYGVQMDKSIYLWIPVVGNIVAVIVIPFVGALSDGIGRRPPIIVGALGAGLLAFAYLHAISIRNVPLAFLLSVLMWAWSTKAITRSFRVSTRSCFRHAPAFPAWPSPRTSARC
jgi:MFS family permease